MLIVYGAHFAKAHTRTDTVLSTSYRRQCNTVHSVHIIINNLLMSGKREIKKKKCDFVYAIIEHHYLGRVPIVKCERHTGL